MAGDSMFKIGNVNINNPIFLAPMAGISNAAYMKICEEMGVGCAITELISSEAIIRNNKKTIDMLKGYEKLNIPIGIQLFGGNPKSMAQAAKYLCDNLSKIDFIDINMGCPVPKIAIRSEAGSSLMKNPKLACEIVKEIKNKINIPVTAKIRSGWDKDNINAIEFAQELEKAGVSAITIHPRTRSQGYSGHSDWNIIKQLKENINIPVIGNGDINNCYDAKKMFETTNCDAIMIGRACIGNPWIIKECNDYLNKKIEPKTITTKEKIEMIKKHINYLLEIKPEKVVVLEMRMHISKYLKGIKGSSNINGQINSAKTVEDIYKILDKGE